MRASEERANKRLKALGPITGPMQIKKREQKPSAESIWLQHIAAILSQFLGKDFKFEVNVPESAVNVTVPETKIPENKPTINVQASEVKPSFHVNVPEQKQVAPVINFKPEIIIPEQKMPQAPQIVYPETPRRWTFQVNRDDRGLITSINAERED